MKRTCNTCLRELSLKHFNPRGRGLSRKCRECSYAMLPEPEPEKLVDDHGECLPVLGLTPVPNEFLPFEEGVLATEQKLEQALIVAREDIDDLKAMVADLGLQVERHRSSRKEAEKELRQLNSALRGQGHELVQCRATIERMDELCTQLETENDRLRADLSALKNPFSFAWVGALLGRKAS